MSKSVKQAASEVLFGRQPGTFLRAQFHCTPGPHPNRDFSAHPVITFLSRRCIRLRAVCIPGVCSSPSLEGTLDE